MQDKNKYLFKNAGYLLIGNFSSKILTFLLVPLYTYVLSTEEYGVYDIMYSTILISIPFVSLNIMDAIMRFSLEQSKDVKNEVFNVTFKYTIIGSLLFSIGSTLVTYFSRIDVLLRYNNYLVPLFIMMLLNQNVIQISRGLDNVKSISIAGVIGTFSTVILNVFFLLIIKWGLVGYFVANIISLFIQNIYLMLSNDMIKYMGFKLKISVIEREMLLFSLPLIFNTLAWYINGVSDRYAITILLGLSANGIYSIAYKIPAILNAFETIFIQSWQLSAVKEINNEEGESFYNQIYENCFKIMFVLCSLTIIFTRFLARILFAADFFVAWKYVPVLIFYVFFNTLSGVIGGVFTAKKESSPLAKTAIYGALVNIILNVVLIPVIGTMGAAIATAISSLFIWGVRYNCSKKYIKYKYTLRQFAIGVLIMMVQAIAMTVIEDIWGYCIQIICLISIILLFGKELLLCLKTKLKRL